ncbi:uncharacterized protein LOC120632274 [Pararge aegeria]|uniref:Jg12932 protein n=1 Tax=Pararge aegeria aegeria TaxID=348720 RepID=A0A8S4SMU8_9NEOP|nr:uncharacterized protein LOC120632274 [Pararge aegeria]CAH2267855.1 jg12932 [Pararge aegeria aegeria]
MSIERRSCTGSAPHVTRRLCATLVFFIGVVCVFGGYLLGRMARSEVRRNNDIVPINLTIAAELLYKRAKRVSPKAVHHNDPEKIAAKLLDAFHCTARECGARGITNNNVAEFVKTSIHYHVAKLTRSIYNASVYLDSLR